MNSKLKKILVVFLASFVILILAGCFGITAYLQVYYHAQDKAEACLQEGHCDITVTLEGNKLAFIPEEPKAGLIFYPGAKVEFSAYAPLMDALANEGILCILVHMPGNLAILNASAADGVQEDYPDIENWYIGGHSLGGAMASSYLAKHVEEYDGLLLLASYTLDQLSETDLSVISVYGSEDGVLRQDVYEKNKTNLPEGFTEVIIDGGCHAYFGDYGEQKGDGTASISPEEQIQQTVDAITAQWIA